MTDSGNWLLIGQIVGGAVPKEPKARCCWVTGVAEGFQQRVSEVGGTFFDIREVRTYFGQFLDACNVLFCTWLENIVNKRSY